MILPLNYNLLLLLFYYDIIVIILILEYLSVYLIYQTRNKKSINLFLYLIISSFSLIFWMLGIKLEYNLIINLGLLLKFSLPPLNIWVIELYKTFNKKEFLIWSLLPKIILIILLNQYYWLFNNLYIILLALIYQSIIALKINNFKMLLGISSVINVIYIFLIYDKYYYYLIYIIHILIFAQYFNKEIINLYYNNIWAYFIFIIVILSMIGIPPFIGFNIKLMILLSYNPLLLIGLILASLYYIKIIRLSNCGKLISNINIKNIALLSILLI